MTPYPHLFTPIKIGGQLIKNRIFSAPTGLMSYTARGHLTTENMAYLGGEHCPCGHRPVPRPADLSG